MLHWQAIDLSTFYRASLRGVVGRAKMYTTFIDYA